MSSHSRSDSTHDPRLDRVLAEYVDAAESGQPPSLADWTARYPEFATELREFAAGRREFQGVVDRAAADLADRVANERTLVGDREAAQTSDGSLGRLQYFGDYELLEEIARGGMGVVFRARQVSLNRTVAVKMILSGELASAEDVARFRAEAESAAGLDHPGIVPIYEIGERDGRHYFSMKFIAGESLSSRLKRETSPNGRHALDRTELRSRVQLVAEVAKAVHFAHQRGIIHRDLKPANILIDADGQPHVTDFGLAKSVSQDSQLTRTGAIVGTPSFMAPEQAHGGGGRVTTAADIYGLGAILYAALTGRPPFEGSTPLDTLLAVQNDPPVPPRQLCAAVDADLETICLKCLAKVPDERYRSAGELADDLGRWLRGDPISAAPPNLTNLLWRWLASNFRTAACVICVGALAGALICESAISNLSHNLDGYVGIYHAQFPGREPPAMLGVIAAYPRMLGVVLLPMGLFCYFSMGWMTDWLVRPQDRTSALTAGLGVGTAAALVAFLVGIGWQTMNQVAIWPSEADLKLLASTVDGQGADLISPEYPRLSPENPERGYWLMKKAWGDMQARIPAGLLFGFLFAVGLLLLPGALQTVAAQLLRARGDAWGWRLMHYLEISFPLSLMLASWGMLLWGQPLLTLGLLAAPVAVAATLPAVRSWPIVPRQLALLTGVALLVAGAIWAAPHLFSLNSGELSPGLMAIGAVATTVAVLQRWRWWARLLVYAVWTLTFLQAGGLVQYKGGPDPAEVLQRKYLFTVLGSAVVLALTAAAARLHRNSPRRA